MVYLIHYFDCNSVLSPEYEILPPPFQIDVVTTSSNVSKRLVLRLPKKKTG